MYKKREKIRVVIGEIKNNMRKLRWAIKTAGMSRAMWYNWEVANPRLKKLRVAAQKLCEEDRTEAVEDANFKSALSGNVAAQCFYLRNKLGWSDSALIHNKIINTNAMVGGSNGKLSDTDKAKQGELSKKLDRYFSN